MNVQARARPAGSGEGLPHAAISGEGSRRAASQGDEGLSPTGAAGCVQDARTSEVWGVQLILAALGYTGADGAPLTTDGRFGLETRCALRAFQRCHGLAASEGGLDTATRFALLRAAGCGVAATRGAGRGRRGAGD